MDVNYLTSRKQLGIRYIAEKRILVYLPLIVNLMLFRYKFVPLFLENSTEDRLKWSTNIEHVPEILSMLGFIFTLWTFAGNYYMEEIIVDKEGEFVKIKFGGFLPAAANMALAIVRLVLYYALDHSRRTERMTFKLRSSGVVLILTSAVSLYYSLIYTLEIRGSSLSFYLKISKFWKYLHTIVTVSLLLFFSFVYENALVQSVVRILCLIVTFHLIMKLLNSNESFYKINYVDSVADVKPIFLILSFTLYFNFFEILDLKLREKSLDVTFESQMFKGCYQALAYYLISCRHKFYMEISPILKCVEYGVALEDSLMQSAFKTRRKAVVRVVSQFNQYFMKRSFKILDRTTFEMEKDLRIASRSYWSNLLAKTPEIATKLAEFMPKKPKRSSKAVKDLNFMGSFLSYIKEVNVPSPSFLEVSSSGSLIISILSPRESSISVAFSLFTRSAISKSQNPSKKFPTLSSAQPSWPGV